MPSAIWAALRGKTIMTISYPYSEALFKQHILIEGPTGTGKTTTTFHLLSLLRQAGVPFLVIEPAKNEYRRLPEAEGFDGLLVFTPGNETIAPFRLNPFEPPAGIYLQTHVGNLVAVFLASFNLWGPTPYVLEQCIYRVYAAKGWDLVTGDNARDGRSARYPTLTDLFLTIDGVVDELNYSKDTAQEIKAALKVRINSLRLGGKGLLLDTRHSYPFAELMSRPVVFELEHIGDDDEKAFIIGLLLTRLYEEHVARGVDDDGPLRHVTVIEEAHRLLQDVPPTVGHEVANVRRKAVETFINILSEIRAYGEGLVIVEQIPTKLARDVVKNTTTKIAHRTVSTEELALMAGVMGMDERQARRMLTLDNGEAAVFSLGDDHPVLVQFPARRRPDPARTKAEGDALIRERMRPVVEAHAAVYDPLPGHVPYRLETVTAYRQAATLAEDRELAEEMARYVLSVVLDGAAAATELPRLRQTAHTLLRHRRDAPALADLLLLCAARDTFERLGDEHGLPYGEVEALSDAFLGLLRATMAAEEAPPAIVARFQQSYRAALQIEAYPFAGCEAVCPARLCLFRHHVRPFVSDARLDRNYRTTLAKMSGDEKWNKLRGIGRTVVRRAVADDAPAEAQSQIAGCFAIQKSHAIDSIDYPLRMTIIGRTILSKRDEVLKRGSEVSNGG